MTNDFSSFSLNVLLQEPARLEKSISLLRDQFDESMTSNYDYFIKTVENVSTITEDLEKCEVQIQEFSSNLKKSVNLCQDISGSGKVIAESLKKTSAAFRNISQIQDVLQIPAMMKACKVSGFNEEALKLNQCISRFSRQFPEIPAIQGTFEESEKVKMDVIKLLMNSFEKKLKITDAIQNMNLLKSSEIYDENELKLAFVKGRFGYLNEKIKKIIPRSTVFDFDTITKKYRNAFNKISTQYHALFNDSDDMTLHIAFRDEILKYCNCLKESLENVNDVNDAKQIMQSALYFVSSLYRIGFSFVPLIDNVFYDSKWSKK